MSAVRQLGYLVFEVSDLEAWEAFATKVLGLEVVDPEPERGFSLRMDGHRRRFFVEKGESDDLGAVGWEVDGPEAVDAISERLIAAGHRVTRGSDEDVARRRVKGLIRFEDPAGNPNEVYWGPELASEPFRSELVPEGFVADEQGLGHVVVLSRDQAEHEAFYSEMLGFELSDYIRCEYFGHEIDVTFMHANARHHSLAFARGQHKRIHHFMIQAKSIDDVGRCYERFLFAGGMVHQTLGRHPNDKMFSFYGYTPSGFHFEFGADAIEIGDAWTPVTHRKVSEWGHQPPQLLTKAYRRAKEAREKGG